MKIVVLDGYVLNPGDLSWKGFEEFGEIIVYDRTDPGDIISRIGDAEAVITNKTVLTKDIIEACPSIRYIGVIATGYNIVDIQAAYERGIPVTNVPGYGTDAVAQFTFSLILELCNRVGMHSESVANGGWIECPDFSYWKSPLIDLKGKTLGIIGYGNIGRRVAEIALAFGMKVLVNSRSRKSGDADNERIQWGTKEEVLAGSDIITLHCPLFEENQDMINKNTIALMKEGAMLINTARGPLVAEEDLVEALNSGKLRGAALDVIRTEPMTEDCPLLEAKNLIITPHIAWASREARSRLMDIAVNNLKCFIEGTPVNVVNL